MSSALVIGVRLHDGRYHGAGDWPPAPARLFQALIAGVGLSGALGSKVVEALKWLERLAPPLICAPYAHRGQRVLFYMPNNNLDFVKGDPRKVAKIRSAHKVFSPWLFDAVTPFFYIWHCTANADDRHIESIRTLAEGLYQFGRGVDMAWAWAEMLHADEVDELLAHHVGPIYHPSAGTRGITLSCPLAGSLSSLDVRYAAYHRRFWVRRKAKEISVTFRQAPRPSFRRVAYESPSRRCVYELRAASDTAAFAPWPLHEVGKLVGYVRDGVLHRLAAALPDRVAEIERVVVGRRPDGTNDGPSTERVRIVPLPSVGHPHADHAVRRLLVEIPGNCPLRANDVSWAFSGLEVTDSDTGEVYPIILTPTSDEGMLRHFGIEEGEAARIWRTVTPAALPERAGRRHIDPLRQAAEAKSGSERAEEQQRAANAVTQALRHAAVQTRPEAIRVQREPFDGNGERVEIFAPGTRFPKERLWHVEIHFAKPVSGPLVIGDGRFLGLGVMIPVPEARGVYVLAIEGGLVGGATPTNVTSALRRAVMARVAQMGISQPLLPFFSGHDSSGTPARSERESHLAFTFDPGECRLLVVPPHITEHRPATPEEREHLDVLDEALRDLSKIRAGVSGVLRVQQVRIDMDRDHLFCSSKVWESVTDYLVTRHEKRIGAHAALTKDLQVECRRRGLPAPSVAVIDARGIRGSGLVGRAKLTFPVPIRGPVLLGRSRYLGGGLFAAATERL